MVRIKKVSDKMITINKNIQSEILMTTMEEIVPEDSLFRKIDKYIDFTFIYDKVKYLYCENNGRPSIDPVVLFKIVFIQALDGIKSMRQTCKKLKVDTDIDGFQGFYLVLIHRIYKHLVKIMKEDLETQIYLRKQLKWLKNEKMVRRRNK